MKLSIHSLKRVMDQKHPLPLVPIKIDDSTPRKFITYILPMEYQDPMGVLDVPKVQMRVQQLTGSESVREVINWCREVILMITSYINFGTDNETAEDTEESIERWNKALKYIKYSLNNQLSTLYDAK